jgi:hypothetical protein
MECDEHDVSKNKRKTDILENNGFKCELVERNCMCKHNSYQASSAPTKSMLRKWDGTLLEYYIYIHILFINFHFISYIIGGKWSKAYTGNV